MNALLALAHLGDPDNDVDTLKAALKPTFLQLVSWDWERRMLVFPVEHPVLGAPICRVEDCSKMLHYNRSRGLCRGCENRWAKGGLPLEDFVSLAKRHWRSTGVFNCQVPGCERPWRTRLQPLCSAHHHQRMRIHRLPLEEFINHPGIKPLPGFGPCQVAACDRARNGHKSLYCQAHHNRLAVEHRRGNTIDEANWRLTTPAIAQTGLVSLRGLPDLVVVEVLYGLQQRVTEGVQLKDYMLRPLCDLVRARQLSSLTEIDLDTVTRMERGRAGGLIKHVLRARLSPETERVKDVWDASVFGLRGHLYFDKIHQPWLREAAKEWSIDDISRRRGTAPQRNVQRQINAIARLSESLRLQRDDEGAVPSRLGRRDITAFLSRMRFLQESGVITAYRHAYDIRDVRRLLVRMRSLRMTEAGRPLGGLPDDVTIWEEDIPDDQEDSEAGRDLPTEVMRQLCDHLDILEQMVGIQSRVAVELLIDTGRRPDEICQLSWDCLERDADGKPVLIYDNRKALRHARRLPVAESTAALITNQQMRARSRFPNTPTKVLKLLPAAHVNPDGTKGTTGSWLSSQHRAWVDSLPAFMVPVVVEVDGQRITKQLPFDKGKVFPYAYRHTYAQRHADAGVPVDVLRELMDHRQLNTTQCYYRVGEERRREAVDRVTAMQFDHRGNRVWRHAKALLDSEHVRRAIGQVAVPYGVCTEPTNVAAGGHDCPVRYRCVGCSHFRTDVSYLPDLEAYLADLLRNRERLAAFEAADTWAKSEAMPSNDEITRVRRLLQRVRDGLADLTDEDRTEIQEAVRLVRRSRQVVSLGMPRARQDLPDLRHGRPM
ncbi:tyrosine-type recombinase/integrase [Streptomyces cinereoruber]|uniref:tyrosine-type recombinase/integrase n=1 Tax=Streptomyces cinereoruber TaxID=67260 RepID=UPI003BF61ED2